MRLRRYLQVIAASTSGTPAAKPLIDAAGIDRSTANAYDSLLSAFSSQAGSRRGRLASRTGSFRRPERHLADPAFMQPLLGIDPRAVLHGGDLLGQILESFVVAQLRAECAVCDLSPRLFHLRDANGRDEAGLLIELADGRVIGIEVKAESAPGHDAARHLRWLQDRVGSQLLLGVVVHTGPRPYQLDDFLALPICALWG